jgi:hypothetical protein
VGGTRDRVRPVLAQSSQGGVSSIFA